MTTFILNHFGALLIGAVVGAVLACLVGTWIARRHGQRPSIGALSIGALLQKHFGNVAADQIEVQSREFPYRVCIDAYQALTNWINSHCRVESVVGVPITNSFMQSVGIGSLLSPGHEGYCHYPTSLEFESFDIGEAEPRLCVKHALWLLDRQGQKLALLWTSETTHAGCGFQTKLRLDFAKLKSQVDNSASQDFFRNLEAAIAAATTYRGKILSLETSSDYRGHSGGITVHRLHSVARDDVILPESTVRLLERNVVRFIQQRPELT